MSDLMVFILVVFLGVALIQLWSQKRFLRDLSDSIRHRQAYLQQGTPGFLFVKAWRDFKSDLNTLIDEDKRLKSDRAAQVGQLQATLESIQEAVLVANDRDEIVLANDMFRKTFAARVGLLGQQVGAVLQSSAFLSYLQDVKEGTAEIRREIEFNVDKGRVWAEVTGSVIRDSEEKLPGLILFVLHDITRLKHLESVRKEFVANVSHELRTPLSMIKGYAETLAEGGEKVSPEDRARFLETIRKHADRLHVLLEDLLTLSRLEGRKEPLTRETVNAGGLIRDIVKSYSETGLVKKDRFRLNLDDREVSIRVDVPKITQVFENLIDNAVKYSGKKPVIEIGSRLAGDVLQIWVKDNGSGIPSRDLPHIFERFYRADKSRSREKGGTGLGLSIVKHIAQLHGGRVWAESKLEEGTTIFFTLPVGEL